MKTSNKEGKRKNGRLYFYINENGNNHNSNTKKK